MSRLQEKKQILEKANYKYNFNKDIYYNKSHKKAFSLEAIEDNEPEWLSGNINAEQDHDDWEFYFNTAPSDRIKKEIIKELER